MSESSAQAEVGCRSAGGRLPAGNVLDGMRFMTGGRDAALRDMERRIEQRRKSYYCFLEANLLSMALGDARLRDVLKHSDGVFLDGCSVQKLHELKYGGAAERLPGPSFLLAACEYGQERGWRHYFYGGAEGVADRMVEKLRQAFPGMIVAGTCSPPFRPLTADEEQRVKTDIEHAAPDILWVGLGGPKQENWMAGHQGKLDVPVMLGVGAAFDFHSGARPWAPPLVRSLKLEWLFRMVTGGRRVFIRNLKCVSRVGMLLAWSYAAAQVAKLSAALVPAALRPALAGEAFGAGTSAAARSLASSGGQSAAKATQDRNQAGQDTISGSARTRSLRSFIVLGLCWALAVGVTGTLFYTGVIAEAFRGLWQGGLAAALQSYPTSPTFWALLLGAFAATACLTPIAMVAAATIGAVDQGGHRKISDRTTPLLGGLAVALPFLVVCALGILGPTQMLRLVADKSLHLWAILIGGAGCLLLGIVDDTRGLRARDKFAAQVILALFVSFCGFAIRTVSLPFVGTLDLGPVAGTLLTVVWIVGLTNAVNIIDGIDGLASGVSLIAAVGLGLIAAIHGDVFVALLCAALIGSLAAFLLFNFHPARIFLGDTGSMFLGFALATIALTGSLKATGAVVFLAPVLALGLPIFEVALSMIRRWAKGLPISAADASHIHHRLLRRGFTQRRVALTLYTASLVCMLAALFTVTARPDRGGSALLLPLGMYAAAMLTIGWLAGYTREVRHTFTVRKRNLFYQAFVNYVTKSLGADIAGPSPAVLVSLMRTEMRLAYLNVEFAAPARTIGVSGAPVADESPAEPLREIQVRTPAGESVRIRYQHDARSDACDRNEVPRHLARIFEHTAITRLSLPPRAAPSPQSRARQSAVEAPAWAAASGGGGA